MARQLTHQKLIFRVNYIDLFAISSPNNLNGQGNLRRGLFEQLDNIEIQKRCKLLDERLKALKGVDTYGGLDIVELNLVSDLIIPPKFKVLDFSKYNGTSCPLMHLKI